MTWKDLPAGARDCLERLTAAGFAAYPVGGARMLTRASSPEAR